MSLGFSCYNPKHPAHCLCELPGRCADCDNLTFCALDCGLAPWNQDRLPPLAIVLVNRENLEERRRFLYLLRFRRWLGFPVNHADVKWMRRPQRWEPPRR